MKVETVISLQKEENLFCIATLTNDSFPIFCYYDNKGYRQYKLGIDNHCKRAPREVI